MTAQQVGETGGWVFRRPDKHQKTFEIMNVSPESTSQYHLSPAHQYMFLISYLDFFFLQNLSKGAVHSFLFEALL